jgi:hypothetical protein
VECPASSRLPKACFLSTRVSLTLRAARVSISWPSSNSHSKFNPTETPAIALAAIVPVRSGLSVARAKVIEALRQSDQRPVGQPKDRTVTEKRLRSMILATHLDANSEGIKPMDSLPLETPRQTTFSAACDY